MTNEQMARGFNEWMRRFTEEPDRFEREFVTVGKFLKDKADGVEPSYGEQATSYLAQIVQEQAS